MNWYHTVLWGGLGGMCPTISKLASSYATQPDQALPNQGVYFGLLLFAFLGAIIALAFGSKEIRAAIASGIAAPAIVTGVISGAEAGPTNAPKDTGQDNSSIIQLVPPAFAEVTSALLLAQSGQSSVTVIVQIDGGAPETGWLAYDWVLRQGVLSGSELNILSTAPQTIYVPQGATEMRIGGETISVSEALKPGVRIELTVHTAPSKDFLWALGQRRRFEIVDVSSRVLSSS